MKPKINKPKPVAERIKDALQELNDALASGRPLGERMTVRTVEIAEPGKYLAKDVRRIRDRLAVSQAVFARLVGVSVELVEHWEQGVVAPRLLARRMLDEINRDPAGFLARQIVSDPKRAAG
jgi:DNA-binding transcriptional regulator YiaG